uniref:Uncharacterized protein n=1 Tax=viral metagenome TaxID=1070528 RepID=A0A6M3KXY7_9ZZZZ
MERLIERVAGKVVCILLHGKSVAKLEQCPELLSDPELVIASLNYFQPVEERILSRIGSQLNLILCTSETEIKKRILGIKEALDRPDYPLFITTVYALQQIPKPWEFVADYRSKIILAVKPDPWPRSTRMPPSLVIYLQALTAANAKRVVLFGCDGADPTITVKQQKRSYYRTEMFMDRSRHTEISLDTQFLNTHYIDAIQRPLYKMWGRRLEVINCNPASWVKVFPTCQYTDVKQYLK